MGAIGRTQNFTFVHEGALLSWLEVTMNKGPSKPVKVENVFAQGFDMMEEAEKKTKRDAKKAAKKAEREAAAAEEAAANPPPPIDKPVERAKINWADADSDDDIDDLGCFGDKFEQEYQQKLLDAEDVSDDEEEEEEDEVAGTSPTVITDFSATQAENTGEKKQLSKK